MAERSTCTHCGAHSPDAAARFCAYCGTEFPREVIPTHLSPHGDVSGRLRAMREHPDFELAQAHVPSVARQQVSAMGGVLFAIAFVVFAAILLIPSMMFPPAAVVIAIALAFGLYFLLSSASKAAKLQRGELKRVAAIVVDERTDISGAGGDGTVQTRYYASLESEAGRREEYEVDGRFSGKVAPGDVGVAYFKGPYLVDFERIPV